MKDYGTYREFIKVIQEGIELRALEVPVYSVVDRHQNWN
jgi:hypothetical protein